MVDDEPSILTLVTEILTELGYQVEVATDGNAAIDAIGKNHPDVVLLDMMMPGLSGWAVMQQIRRQAGGRTIPFIVMSTMVSDEEAAEMGAFGCLRKPFTLADVITAVNQATSRS